MRRAFPNTGDQAAGRGFDIERSYRELLGLCFNGDAQRVERVIEAAAEDSELPLPTDPRYLDSVGREHGWTGYLNGCRCPVCHAAMLAQKRDRAERRREPSVEIEGTPLTYRQLQLLACRSLGMTLDVAAGHLGLGINTVKDVQKATMRRLRCRNSEQAVAMAIRQGWLD